MIDVSLKFNTQRYAMAEGYPSGSSKGSLESLRVVSWPAEYLSNDERKRPWKITLNRWRR
jgi:hypothetical protein